MTEKMPDTVTDYDFAERAFRTLPPARVSMALEARIMAGFDAAMARRQQSPGNRLRAALHAAFPGIRPWQPAFAFAMALMIGGVAGTFLPRPAATSAAPAAIASIDSDTDSTTLYASADADSQLPALAMAGDL